jgi:hypothetical protein
MKDTHSMALLAIRKENTRYTAFIFLTQTFRKISEFSSPKIVLV